MNHKFWHGSVFYLSDVKRWLHCKCCPCGKGAFPRERECTLKQYKEAGRPKKTNLAWRHKEFPEDTDLLTALFGYTFEWK